MHDKMTIVQQNRQCSVPKTSDMIVGIFIDRVLKNYMKKERTHTCTRRHCIL